MTHKRSVQGVIFSQFPCGSALGETSSASDDSKYWFEYF